MQGCIKFKIGQNIWYNMFSKHNVTKKWSNKCCSVNSVAQLVEHGTSNAKIMGSIPRESKSW